MREIVDGEGAGAHYAHVTADDIHKLQEFIQAARPEKPAEFSKALRVRQQSSVFTNFIGHTSEFIQIEDPLIHSGPCLLKNDRAAKFDPDQQSCDQQQRAENDQRKAGQDNVQETFYIFPINPFMFQLLSPPTNYYSRAASVSRKISVNLQDSLAGIARVSREVTGLARCRINGSTFPMFPAFSAFYSRLIL